MNNSKQIKRTIDTSGTRCPIPLLRAKQALRSMEVGEILEVITTDPSAEADFAAMLKHLPHSLLEYYTKDNPRIDTFLIEKGAQ